MMPMDNPILITGMNVSPNNVRQSGSRNAEFYVATIGLFNHNKLIFNTFTLHNSRDAINRVSTATLQQKKFLKLPAPVFYFTKPVKYLRLQK